MRVVVYLRRNSSTPQSYSPQMLAAISGFERHGLKPEVQPIGQPVPCDLAVCWGIRKKGEMASGRRALIMERGYVGDRYHWTSMGFDGLNGYADFCNVGMPSKRWDDLFSEHMRPWRASPYAGEYVLILGQVPRDSSLRGMDIHEWCQMIAFTLLGRDIPVKIRMHPLDPSAPVRLANARRTRNMQKLYLHKGTLQEALDGAKWVVAYNSNAAVDAVLYGIPAVTMDRGSMAWPVTGHVPWEPPIPVVRREWAHDLAYTQWSIDEIERGDAWDHLKAGMEI